MLDFNIILQLRGRYLDLKHQWLLGATHISLVTEQDKYLGFSPHQQRQTRLDRSEFCTQSLNEIEWATKYRLVPKTKVFEYTLKRASLDFIQQVHGQLTTQYNHQREYIIDHGLKRYTSTKRVMSSLQVSKYPYPPRSSSAMPRILAQRNDPEIYQFISPFAREHCPSFQYRYIINVVRYGHLQRYIQMSDNDPIFREYNTLLPIFIFIALIEGQLHFLDWFRDNTPMLHRLSERLNIAYWHCVILGQCPTSYQWLVNNNVEHQPKDVQAVITSFQTLVNEHMAMKDLLNSNIGKIFKERFYRFIEEHELCDATYVLFFRSIFAPIVSSHLVVLDGWLINTQHYRPILPNVQRRRITN
jgi:hypothetical protein